MPSDAADIATAYAKSVGWLPESGGFLVRNVVMDGVELRPSVNIFPRGLCSATAPPSSSCSPERREPAGHRLHGLSPGDRPWP